MKNAELLGAYFVLVFLVVCTCFAVGAWLWPYTINTWLVYGGKEPAFEWWMGGLACLVPGLGQMCIPGAVITWITMLFLS